MKSLISISRKWHNPKIEMELWMFQEAPDNTFIRLNIELEDFIKAIQEEIGSVTWVFTKDGFKGKFDNAVKNVISGIKEESTKIV
jgi:hypothetical protein